MENHLCRDVLVHILTQYSLSHAPIVQRARRGWYNILMPFAHYVTVPVDDDDESTLLPVTRRLIGSPLSAIARDGYIGTLRHFLAQWQQASSSSTTKKKKPPNLRNIARGAACGGKAIILALCYDYGLGVDDIENAMEAAAMWGHSHIVRECKGQYGARDCNPALRSAACHGHDDIVRLCVTWGATDLSKAMCGAARYGREHTMRLLWTELGGPIDYNMNDAMRSAALFGHEHIVRLCHNEWGATNVREVMAIAAAWGHHNIVRFCHDECNASNINEAMAAAAQCGHADIVRMCYHDWGAGNVNLALELAAEEGHLHIVRLCREELGATTSVDRIAFLAAMCHHTNIVQLCVDVWGATAPSKEYVEKNWFNYQGQRFLRQQPLYGDPDP